MLLGKRYVFNPLDDGVARVQGLVPEDDYTAEFLANALEEENKEGDIGFLFNVDNDIVSSPETSREALRA